MARRSEKPSHIAQQDWDDADIPELSETDFAKGVPFKDACPQQFETWKRNRGRPPIESRPKVHVGFGLAADVVDAVKASGRGYNARVENVLREAIAKGLL